MTDPAMVAIGKAILGDRKVPLKPYMLHGGDSGDGAVLAFAVAGQAAKVLGWQTCSELHDIAGGEYINIRARPLPPRPDIMDQQESEDPHVIVSPRCCPTCEMWGGEPRFGGTLCEFCEDECREEPEW